MISCTAPAGIAVGCARHCALAPGPSSLERPQGRWAPAKKLRIRAAADDGAAAPPAAPSVAKGNIVRVNKDKYINSIEFKAVDHPTFFKGLDYIYEARGEVLDLRSFATGEYALIAWAGIPTAPAWLPVYMLEKAPKLEYKRV